MKHLRLNVLAVAAVWFLGLAVPAHAQCVVIEDPADMFRTAEAVFVGTVKATEPTGARGFHIVMHRAAFEVERVWKGRLKRFETVGTVEALQPGKRYVVFAGGKRESGSSVSLTTSLECGWSELEPEAQRKLQWLAEKADAPVVPSDN